ncbi:uncharacterized protein LOC127602290 [Scomber scombrus]|uniref:Uncharacterized protein LOC127602290 n=1 Tax=Scomber scombrus TaxID=13677 RepID=A0AAV1MUN4_SCOSC
MHAGTVYMECHNQVAGIEYRNICTKYGLEVPRSGWKTPPKVVENSRVVIMWDFQIQTDKLVTAEILSESNIRKKEYDKLEKHQGLNEELEKDV